MSLRAGGTPHITSDTAIRQLPCNYCLAVGYVGPKLVHWPFTLGGQHQ
jgi:hypothetical protein